MTPLPPPPPSRRSGPDPKDLISVRDARTRVLAAFAPLPLESVPLLDARDRVLGEEVVAPRDVPPFANSAMDGFACRASDLALASKAAPVVLDVAATIMAGDGQRYALPSGTAMRIMTGAPLPAGADIVIAVERTVADPDDPGRV